jgi:hypothetical protein
MFARPIDGPIESQVVLAGCEGYESLKIALVDLPDLLFEA